METIKNINFKAQLLAENRVDELEDKLQEFGINSGSVRIITFVSATELAKELNPRIPGVDVIVVNGRLTPNMSHPTAWLDTNHDMYKNPCLDKLKN